MINIVCKKLNGLVRSRILAVNFNIHERGKKTNEIRMIVNNCWIENVIYIRKLGVRIIVIKLVLGDDVTSIISLCTTSRITLGLLFNTYI